MGVLQDAAQREKLMVDLLQQIANGLKNNRSALDGDYTIIKRLPTGLVGYDFRIVRKEGEMAADYTQRTKIQCDALEKIVKEQTNLAAVSHFRQNRKRFGGGDEDGRG